MAVVTAAEAPPPKPGKLGDRGVLPGGIAQAVIAQSVIAAR